MWIKFVFVWKCYVYCIALHFITLLFYCLLFSPMCRIHLLTCTGFNSASITCPPSFVLNVYDLTFMLLVFFTAKLAWCFLFVIQVQYWKLHCYNLPLSYTLCLQLTILETTVSGFCFVCFHCCGSALKIWSYILGMGKIRWNLYTGQYADKQGGLTSIMI